MTTLTGCTVTCPIRVFVPEQSPRRYCEDTLIKKSVTMVKSGRPDCTVVVEIADCSNRLCHGRSSDECCVPKTMEEISASYTCTNGDSFPVTVSMPFSPSSLLFLCGIKD